jgi:SAM-dependent methyltransferase
MKIVSPRNRRRRTRRSGLSAASAEKFTLYEKAVQAPDFDIQFLTRIFRREHDRLPLSLREDFCGTAYLAAEWVRSRPDRTAIAIDLDDQALEWGRRRHLQPLGPAARRLRLLRRNVLEVAAPRVELAVAFNYSYFVFHDRAELLAYFRIVRRGLRPGGAFVLDGYTGPDAFEPMEEVRRCRGFTYVWDQQPMDALSGRAKRFIHFRFPDGTALKRAFKYDWRLWSVPEVRDLLGEAGYGRIDLYTGEDTYRKVARETYEGSIIPILVAWR